ncbi:MAG: desulfoferrodoxin [Oscillospiraceae bacterium]|nr:desulfoferrodoxin [Oscillospiraceae bacterium]
MARFLLCKRCGNLVGMIESSGAPMTCCGDEMSELAANSADAAKEKHVPVVSVSGDTVTVNVGSAPHPMDEGHLIKWIYLRTDAGGHRKSLTHESKPAVEFALKKEQPISVYAYCNLHGLWKTELF